MKEERHACLLQMSGDCTTPSAEYEVSAADLAMMQQCHHVASLKTYGYYTQSAEVSIVEALSFN